MKMKNVFKSTGVVLFAFVACALLSIVTDFLLESIGVLSDPSEGLFNIGEILLVLFYRGIYTVFSGYLIGRFAPNKPMLHGLILGMIGIGLTLSVAIMDPSFAEEKSPLWFVYALVGITLPCIWLGVKINESWQRKTKN